MHFVLYFCLSYWKTQTSVIFLCVYTHKEAVLIPVNLVADLSINICRIIGVDKTRWKKDKHSLAQQLEQDASMMLRESVETERRLSSSNTCSSVSNSSLSRFWVLVVSGFTWKFLSSCVLSYFTLPLFVLSTSCDQPHVFHLHLINPPCLPYLLSAILVVLSVLYSVCKLIFSLTLPVFWIVDVKPVSSIGFVCLLKLIPGFDLHLTACK